MAVLDVAGAHFAPRPSDAANGGAAVGVAARQGTLDAKLLVAIYLVTLAVRGATAYLVNQPGFTDAFYYIDIARNLHAGRGFVEDFIWNYLEPPADVSHPSNSYWGPLASLLVLPAFWLAGPSFRAAQAPMVALSSLLPLVSYATARHFSASRRQALGAAILTIFSGVYFAYWTVPDGAIPFSLAGSIALLAISKGIGGSWRWAAVAGAAIAAAQLSRSDGMLLLVVFLGLGALAFARRSELTRRAVVVFVLAGIAAYFVVMAPWLYRNLTAFGSPFYNPGLKTIFLREYNDVFTVGRPVDLGYYLAWGLGAILWSKAQAAAANLHVLSELLSYILAPLALLGLAGLVRDRRALPFLAYGAVLFAAMTFAFSYPGPLGAFLHSVVALLPFLTYAVARGLDGAVDVFLRWRSHLHPSTARRFCWSIVIAGQITLTIGLAAVALRDWNQRYSYELYPDVVSWLSPRLSENEPVMILDPPAYTYYSGRSAIVVPNDDLATLVALAKRYQVRYLVLEPAHTKPMDNLYKGRDVPQGITPVLSLASDRGKELKVYEID